MNLPYSPQTRRRHISSCSSSSSSNSSFIEGGGSVKESLHHHRNHHENQNVHPLHHAPHHRPITKRVSAPDVRDVHLMQLYQRMAERNNQMLQRRGVQKALRGQQHQLLQQQRNDISREYFSDSGWFCLFIEILHTFFEFILETARMKSWMLT